MRNLKSLSVKLFSISLIVFIALFIFSECSTTDKKEQPIVNETGEVELKKQAEAEKKKQAEAEKKKQEEDAQKELDSLFK